MVFAKYFSWFLLVRTQIEMLVWFPSLQLFSAISINVQMKAAIMIMYITLGISVTVAYRPMIFVSRYRFQGQTIHYTATEIIIENSLHLIFTVADKMTDTLYWIHHIEVCNSSWTMIILPNGRYILTMHFGWVAFVLTQIWISVRLLLMQHFATSFAFELG